MLRPVFKHRTTNVLSGVRSVRVKPSTEQDKVTRKRLLQSRPAGPGPHRMGPDLIVISGKGAEERQGGLTCLEWDFGSGGLKKESGSFLSLMGTEGGTMVFFGFITALKSASRSVSESPRTWTIWCPAGGLCWLGSIVPKHSANFCVSGIKKKKIK